MRLGYALSERGSGLDATFDALAHQLAGAGLNVTGAIQATTRDAAGKLATMELLLLPGHEPVNIAQPLSAGTGPCRLDPGALEQASLELARRVEAGADLLIVPRFGEREAEGRGFRDLIATGLGCGVPVLVGVGSEWRAAFDTFSDGAGEALAPTTGALAAWVLQPTREA